MAVSGCTAGGAKRTYPNAAAQKRSFEEKIMAWRKIIVCSALLIGAAAIPMPADAKTVIVEVGPPALRVETVPPARTGYYWAPGYWGWNRGKHVWVGGHWIRERRGY